MFSRIAKPLRLQAVNKFSTSSQHNVKVAILGAAGGIGQPLSLLLKQSPLITRLHLYDIRHTLGVAADLAHIETPARVCGFNGPDCLGEALKDSEIVVIPAGLPRKPGMTRDDLFGANATVTYELANAIAKHCPKAIVGIITNPVNSTVPIASEVMIKNNCYDPRKILGVSTLDTVRSNTFVAELNGWDPVEVNVPVIGGHSGITIIPLLSQAKPPVKMQPDEAKKLFTRVQEAGTEVVKAKEGAGSATLSMAFAAARFTNKLCQALLGATDIVECAYVRSDIVPGVKYFATPILLGKNGIEKNLGLPPLSDIEKEAVQLAIPELKKEIAKGEEFGKNRK